METYKKNGLELISNLALSNTKYPSVVKYTPSKTKISQKEKASLPRVLPERVGIPSSVIIDLINDLEAEPRANLHSMVIVKDGAVIAECARKGYSARLAHLSHSMSKTVTGMIIGMLIDDGKLSINDSLEKFFPEYDIHPETAKITVENLLIMSSGIAFSEIGAVTDTRWTETFLSSVPSFKEGEKFAYNSMNSYMLMAIAHKIISEEYGLSVEEFLNNRLFEPLSISEYFWEIGPEEIEKGGWGLYHSAESWAKLGIMMLRGGVYGEKRILSEEFVTAATSTQSITPNETGDFNYGYQLWVARTSHDFLFNGMLGQNVLVIPSSNIVVAINSGNNELFQESPALAILRKHLSKSFEPIKPRLFSQAYLQLEKRIKTFYDSRARILPKEKKHGIAQFFGLKTRTPFDDSFSPLLEKKFVFADNNHGILPLFVRAMQNNYQGGIRSFEFKRDGEYLILSCTEGEDNYVYKIGIYDYEFSDIDYKGEKYTVGALATRSENTDECIVYSVEFIFPELPNSRMLRLTLSPLGKLTVEMSENPDSKITDSFISSIPAMSPKINFALSMLESNLGKNFIERRVAELFSPTLIAIYEKAEDFEKLLGSENEKIKEKLASLSMVRMLISKFTGVQSEEDENKKAPSLGGMLISSLLGNFFSRKNPDEQ